MKRFACCVFAAVAALPITALAQHEAVVVTATRQPAPLDRLPYSVKILDEAELSGFESLDGALEMLPDIYVQTAGGRSGFASLFFRGADPNFTTVLLEGVPLNSPTNSRGGAFNVASIPTAAIGRAELVAGPSSTLYGSGALAGALNLLLPEPTVQPRVSFGGSTGSENERSAVIRWQGPATAHWGASLGAVLDDAGTAVPDSRFRSRSFDLLLAARNDRANRLIFHIADTRSRGFPDGSGGPAHAQIDDVERRSSDELIVALDHGLARVGQARLALSASYFVRQDKAASPGVAPSPFSPDGIPAGEDDIRYRSAIVKPTLSLDFGAWQATLGAQGQWEHARSEGYLDFGAPVPSGFELTRATGSVFAELNRTLGDVLLDGGLRFDSVEDVGSRLTGRAGLRAQISPHTALRISGGSAWKAPSFYAVANPFVGNPDLIPESGANVEVGLEQTLASRARFSVTLFTSRYRNLIDFVPGDVPRLENRAVVKANGLTTSLDYSLNPALSIALGGQYVVTRDAGDEAPLLHRPRWRGTAVVHWRTAHNLDFRMRYALTGERYDFAVPIGTQALDSTHLGSVSLDWRPGQGREVRVAAENLFNERTGDTLGFPGLPRRIRIALMQRF